MAYRPIKTLPDGRDTQAVIGWKRRCFLDRYSCQRCGRAFEPDPVRGWPGVTLMSVTQERTEMRGDDVVTFYHPECFDLTFPGMRT